MSQAYSPSLMQTLCLLKSNLLSLFLMLSEVTKVRRNLFNQEMISPSKRSVKKGLPRSHSVSAVEGLEYKHDSFKRTKGTSLQGNLEKWFSTSSQSPGSVLRELIKLMFSSPLWLPSVNFPLGISLPPSLDEELLLVFFSFLPSERQQTNTYFIKPLKQK